MNDDKKISDEYFEFMLKRASKELAEEDGQKYIEELEGLEEPEYSQKYKNYINNLAGAKIYNKRNYKKFVQIASAFLIFAVIGSVSIYKADADFRLFVNKIFTNGDGHIDISTNISEQDYDFSSVPDNWEYFYVPEYVPEGYRVEKITSNYFDILIKYSDGENSIFFNQENSIEGTMSIDTEHTIISEIKVNGYDGLLLDTGVKNTIIWEDRDFQFSISGHLDKKELIKIAESLEIINK